jgi:putative lipoic acid-binding regulatory protein
MSRPKIDYPCEWEYRLIGLDEEELRKAVSEIIKTKQYTLSFSNISKEGKYISLSLKTIVITEEERNNIYVSLRKHPAVKSVI